MIHITETAAQAITTTCKSADTEVAGLRLSLIPSGCNGYSYSFEFIETVDENDDLFQAFSMIEEGYVLAVDEKNLPNLDGMTIDYTTKNFCSTYEFINPNQKGQCGCGISINL